MEITKSLYNLLHEEIHLLNNLDTAQEETFIYVAELLLKKADNVAGYLEHLDDQLDLVKSKINKLKDIESAIKARSAKFEEYIQRCIELNEGPINGNEKVLKLVSNPPSVEIIDQDKIDVQFLEVRQEVVVKKKEILDQFKKTGEVPCGTNIVHKKRVKIGSK